MEKMYFGRGIETSEKSELWHRDIWQRSPLYGDATIFIDNGKTRSIIYLLIRMSFNLFSVEYAVEEFVEFIDNSNQREQRFGRIEAIVSLLLPQDSDHPQDALKMSRLLRHDKLRIYCSHDRSHRRHKEL